MQLHLKIPFVASLGRLCIRPIFWYNIERPTANKILRACLCNHQLPIRSLRLAYVTILVVFFCFLVLGSLEKCHATSNPLRNLPIPSVFQGSFPFSGCFAGHQISEETSKLVSLSGLSVIINIQHLRNAALCLYSAPQKRNPSFSLCKVDELSLLTTNGSSPVEGGAYMVAFAGRKYAARSVPVLISDSTMTIKSFTLVLEFQKGTLQNLYWKKFGCKSCSKDMVCFNGQDCAVPNSKCTSNGGIVDCGIGVQLAFSGTDKNLEALNSWYEVSNLRQYSLYGLYSDLRDSISGLGKIF